MKKARPIPMPNPRRVWWVAREAGSDRYFGWETNEGTAWVPLKQAHRFSKREEAAMAVSVPVPVEVCEIDDDYKILRVELA